MKKEPRTLINNGKFFKIIYMPRERPVYRRRIYQNGKLVGLVFSETSSPIPEAKLTNF